MDEFIVWDKNRNIFCTQGWVLLDSDGDVYGAEPDTESDLTNLIEIENKSIHYAIGKTDINGKKIYAESSIVEFGKERRGFFKWNKIRLMYMFVDLEHSAILKAEEIFSTYDYFKIIDTIQENKLGLMEKRK